MPLDDPDFGSALDQAAAVLSSGGSLHVVGFGDFRAMPRPMARALKAWLGHFHVNPCAKLNDIAAAVAAARSLTIRERHGPLC